MNKFIAHTHSDTKQEQSLETHLSEVAELAAAFANKIGLYNQGYILGLLHDFGKYSKAFQDYIKSAVGDYDKDDIGWVDAKSLKGKIDHSTAGAKYVWKQLSNYPLEDKGHVLCAQILALCIASHHSGLINSVSKLGEPDFHKRIYKPDDKCHYEECVVSADREIIDKANSLLNNEFIGNFLKAIKREKYTTISNFHIGMLTRFLFSCLIDADRINSAEFETPDRKKLRLQRNQSNDWAIAISRLEDKLTSFESSSDSNDLVNRIRKNISDNCLKRSADQQGVYTLTVPTGGGKTLASLLYALHHAKRHSLERIIYIIPYTSIIEQNAKAVRDIIEREGDGFEWVLEHHSNLEPENNSWRRKIVSENWDAPIVFTTMVQFLEVLFSGGTRNVRRMHQLANSVLIFDEIQTLPIKCTHLFSNAINYLTENARTTTLLCTATQPLLDKLPNPNNGQIILADHIDGAEIVEDTTQLFNDLSRVTINYCYEKGGWSETKITELIASNFYESGNCLVIVNTKSWAQLLYKTCSLNVEGGVVFHLSTNQCAAHRKDILAKVRDRLENNQPVLCISTQLIEAGVDIDFSSVIRFTAGLDSIAQAAGRCNRNGKLRDGNGQLIKGKVTVINPYQENIDLLTDIKVGQSITERILRNNKYSDLLAPDAINEYFTRYFFDRADEMVYPVNNKQGHHHKNILNWLSNNSSNISNRNKAHLKEAWVPLLQQSFKDAGEFSLTYGIS